MHSVTMKHEAATGTCVRPSPQDPAAEPRIRTMKPFNLFVYGTLMNPDVFRAVLGRRLVRQGEPADGVENFCAEDAVLDSYKKVSPDNAYFYAVPDPHGRIRGYVIGPLPGDCMNALRKFEGRNYRRARVRVQTKDGRIPAVAFVGHLEQMEHSFGHEFRDPLKQEILLRRKIDAALLADEREQLHTDTSLTRRAIGQLHGRTIRDIVRRHFEAGGISDYAIRHSLKEDPLRDFSRITADPAAAAVAPNYLAMVVRQAVFNEVEEYIRRDFRYELDHMGLADQYYDRTISSLAALRLLNASPEILDLMVGDALTDLKFQRDHLVDYVRWAIMAADAMYDSREAKREVEYISTHMGHGHIPMGAELEFSNIGQDVIRDPQAKCVRDPLFDGFLYFNDYALDVLTWKLGGHVDDHHEKASARPRRGFFEVALGSLSIEANLSKPVTDDPWVLNQFIHETRQFFQIQPHSVHISLQLRSQHRPVRDRTLASGSLKCLFAIAGDPVRGADGRLRIHRLISDEIITAKATPSMMFCEISRRHSRQDDEAELVRPGHAKGRYVQQFKFLRLSPRLNYEPVAMALKGLQLCLSPGSFMTPYQYRNSPKHRELFEDLVAWGASPQRIGRREIDVFLGDVHEGLMSERRGQPAHSEAYIAWSINQLRSTLDAFNALVTKSAQPQTPVKS